MTLRLALLLGLLGVSPLAAQTTVETISFWNGNTTVQPFGKSNTATYGQTFTVPGTDNVLQSFSFFLSDFSASDQLIFRAYVSRWDAVNSRLTGPLLFTSGNETGPGPGGAVRYDFLTGGLSLTTGDMYIAFLSASGLFGDIPVAESWARQGYLDADEYAGGAFWYLNNGDDFSLLSTSTWENLVGDGIDDTAFELKFGAGAASTVPEPSTVLLLGTGMGVLLLGVRRRRRQ